jgi:predicted RNase H-related nuclease YkuK (DUF458 family)
MIMDAKKTLADNSRKTTTRRKSEDPRISIREEIQFTLEQISRIDQMIQLHQQELDADLAAIKGYEKRKSKLANELIGLLKQLGIDAVLA